MNGMGKMEIRSPAKVRALGAVLMALCTTSHWAIAAPAFVCVTPTHRIEVEAVSGSDQYDYRSWRLNKPGDGPALVLRGSMELQGTGECRTRYWTFKNGKYEYAIADSVNCGEQMPPSGAMGRLWVHLSGKEISQSWCTGKRTSHTQSHERGNERAEGGALGGNRANDQPQVSPSALGAAIRAERTVKQVENCSAAFREHVDGKWLCRKLTVEEAKVEADIDEAAKARTAYGRGEDERFAVNIKGMEEAAQAMMDIERKYPWSSRIADRMARGTSRNHCMSVLRAVAAYEKNRLSVPADLVVGARNTGCL